MRRIATVGVLMIAVGCNQDRGESATQVPPPSTKVAPTAKAPARLRPWEGLSPGDDAMVYSRESGVLLETGDSFASLPVGTRVRFLEETDDGGKARVKVLEGDHAEAVGKVLRLEVRPLPSHKR